MVGPAFGCTYAIWQEAGDDEANFSWMRGASQKIAPISLGHYIGEADLDRSARLRGSFSPAVFERLWALRNTYDPNGLFHYPGMTAESLRKAG